MIDACDGDAQLDVEALLPVKIFHASWATWEAIVLRAQRDRGSVRPLTIMLPRAVGEWA